MTERIVMNNSLRVKVAFDNTLHCYPQALELLDELGWQTDASMNGGVAVVGTYHPGHCIMDFGTISLDDSRLFLNQGYRNYCFTAITAHVGSSK
jgi:hypothetical protein